MLTHKDRAKLNRLALDNGFSSLTEALEHWSNDTVVPAMCEEACDVEPDGKCPHGHSSVLLFLGMV